MRKNVVNAIYDETKRIIKTAPLYQYDYGQILKFVGVELPVAYEVHFSDLEYDGFTKTSIGDSNGVAVPDEFLKSGRNVYAFAYLHTGAHDGETVIKVMIPVCRRPESSDEEPTPEQQSVIDQAIAALDAAVEQTAKSAEDAADAAQRAEDAADSIKIDETLTQYGEAADAGAVGKRFEDVGFVMIDGRLNVKYEKGDAE